MADVVAVRARPERLLALIEDLWADGDVVLPLDVDAPQPAVDRLLALLRPAAVFDATAQGPVKVTRLPDPRQVADGSAVVVATSGSTGSPKGVLLSHQALRASTRAGLRRLGCRTGDCWMLALPTHHVAGLQVLLRAASLGTQPLIVPAGDAERLVAAARQAPAPVHVSLVPTQLARLVDLRADLSVFATVLLGGAAAPAGLLEAAAAAGAAVATSYGMTETCGGCVYDGVPLDGVEVEVRHDGRIRIRGPVLCDGYLDDPTPVTDPEGWFTTSDVGAFTAEGRLEVRGRIDDMVVSGGENVPTGAVEAALRQHPRVADVAVTGRPDPRWGQAVVAVVVPSQPSDPPSLEELRDHVRSLLPATWAPQALQVVASLPRSGLGKVPRDALRALLRDAR